MAPPTLPLRPLDTLWQATSLIWVILAGEALAIVLALAPGVSGQRLIYFGIASFVIQWIAMMSLGLLYLARRRLAKLRPVVVAQTALAALLLSTWLVCGLAWLLLRDIWPTPDGGWLMFSTQLSAIALTVGLLGLAAFQNHWRTRQLAIRAKQAELEALQARIRPHFLFNTLNAGAALVHARPEEAERLLLDLADLFRAALAGPSELPLLEELTLARRYLEIEKLRFGERLQVEWHLPDIIPDVATPTLSLQPLVENAIRHGVEPCPGGGTVTITVAPKPGEVWITVTNPLPMASMQSTAGHQVGLSSVRARIEALTQGKGRVETSAADGTHTASIVLPLSG